MNNIIDKLSKIYFTKLEAAIYIELLKEPGQTAYQLAKTINVSRSSVYPVVENMYQQGIILLMSSDSLKYYPENPHTLITKLKDNYVNNADQLEDELSALQSQGNVDYLINIKGEDSNLSKAKELLVKSKKEVYLNTDYPLEVFDKELAILEQNQVRVIYFTFADRTYHRSNVEIYAHKIKVDKYLEPTRIMLVSDCKEVLLACKNKTSNDWLGTVSNNELLVKITGEHIHHDIYLTRIYELSGVNYFDDKSDKCIFLNTLNELKVEENE